MSRTLISLDQITVKSPCTEDWDGMLGTGRVRLCGSCEKNVYDLTGLSDREVSDLVAEKEGHLCVRFFVRVDGTVTTSLCPSGSAAFPAPEPRAWPTVAAGLVLALVGLSEAAPPPESRTGGATPGITTNAPPVPVFRETKGEMCVVAKPVRKPVEAAPMPREVKAKK